MICCTPPCDCWADAPVSCASAGDAAAMAKSEAPTIAAPRNAVGDFMVFFIFLPFLVRPDIR
jgi:hypothetical protein